MLDAFRQIGEKPIPTKILHVLRCHIPYQGRVFEAFNVNVLLRKSIHCHFDNSENNNLNFSMGENLF